MICTMRRSNKPARRPRDEAGVAGALLTVVEAYAAVVLFGSRIQSSPEGEKHRIHWRNYSLWLAHFLTRFSVGLETGNLVQSIQIQSNGPHV
jgi:hypothetical protein